MKLLLFANKPTHSFLEIKKASGFCAQCFTLHYTYLVSIIQYQQVSTFKTFYVFYCFYRF
nr:MAG TPA: hypothetical protein [Caudoviricetes sp.]